jgi:hypothetical protein
LKAQKKTLALLLAALALGLGLVACGGDSSSSESDSSSETVVEGSQDEGVRGSFTPLANAPGGYAKVAGTAELKREDGKSTTTIELTGLEPNTEYMAHLHVAGCQGSDPGGPHFQFQKGGSEEPPNEIHLSFESDAEGAGGAEVESREVPVGEAGSVVLHLASHHQMASLLVHGDEEHGAEGEEGHHDEAPDKIACAELEGGDPEAQGQDTNGEAAAEVPTVVVKNGEPVGGIAKLEVDAGDQIRFKVEGDEAEEIHLHGYDVMEEIPAGGGTVEFDLPAEIEGIFEAELEGQGVQILELVVNP